MKSLPSGGDVLIEGEKEESIIHWMQWINREEFHFVLFNHDLKMMSGPHDSIKLKAYPSDHLALLLYTAYYEKCIGKNNEP